MGFQKSVKQCKKCWEKSLICFTSQLLRLLHCLYRISHPIFSIINHHNLTLRSTKPHSIKPNHIKPHSTIPNHIKPHPTKPKKFQPSDTWLCRRHTSSPLGSTGSGAESNQSSGQEDASRLSEGLLLENSPQQRTTNTIISDEDSGRLSYKLFSPFYFDPARSSPYTCLIFPFWVSHTLHPLIALLNLSSLSSITCFPHISLCDTWLTSWFSCTTCFTCF